MNFDHVMDRLSAVVENEMLPILEEEFNAAIRKEYPYYELHQNFVENEIFTLNTHLPIADEQGAYKVEDMIAFVVEFNEIYQKFVTARTKLLYRR